MVEKIPVRPESVRGLGNIISPAKTLDDFTVYNSSLSYVDGLYTMEYVTSNVIVELTASASSITVGESLVLTATVTDGGTAVEGASVSFSSGNLVIGTAVTDANGVASVTTSTLEAGSYSITATYDEVVSSAVSVTVNTAFTSVTVTSDKSILSYADSESATLTAQLMNGASTASVSGETVEFYRYVDGTNDVLVDSGQTDNNGVATGSYTSAGIGDIQVYAKVRSLSSEIFVLEDCSYYSTTEYKQNTDGISSNIALPSTFKLEYDITPTSQSTSGWGSSCYLRIGADSNSGVWAGQLTSAGRHGLMPKPSGTTQYCTSNTVLNTANHITVVYNGSTVSYTCNNETVTLSASNLGKINGVVPTTNNGLKNIKVKPL